MNNFYIVLSLSFLHHLFHQKHRRKGSKHKSWAPCKNIITSTNHHSPFMMQMYLSIYIYIYYYFTIRTEFVSWLFVNVHHRLRRYFQCTYPLAYYGCCTQLMSEVSSDISEKGSGTEDRIRKESAGLVQASNRWVLKTRYLTNPTEMLMNPKCNKITNYYYYYYNYYSATKTMFFGEINLAGHILNCKLF